MRNSQVTKFLILFVFVFLCSCDLFKSMCEAEKPPKQSTTLQQIVNDTNAGETIDLEKYSNEYDITDYNAEISKNLTIKNGSFQNTTLKIKAEVKLERVQELSVETSANLTIRDSKLNNLLLGTNAESRSTNSGNTNFDLKVIVKNCEIAEKIKINSKAKLNIAGEKTKIAKIVVAVAAEVCKILCTTEVDTKKIENVITDENGEKPEEIKITQAYKITYHSNCDELEDIEDFFSPDDGTISLPTDIFKRNGYIFAGWYYDNNQAVEDSINVSDKTADINVYAKWESAAVNKIAGIYKLLNESATIEIKNDGTFVVTVTISGDIDGYMNGNWKKANEENYEFIFDDNTAGTATSIEEDVIKMVYKNENEGMDIDSYAVKISNENVDLSGTWIDENSIIIIKEDTFTATLKDGSSKNGNIEKIGNFFKLETFAWGAISASKQALYIDPYGKEITPSVYTKSTTNEENFEDQFTTTPISWKTESFPYGFKFTTEKGYNCTYISDAAVSTGEQYNKVYAALNGTAAAINTTSIDNATGDSLNDDSTKIYVDSGELVPAKMYTLTYDKKNGTVKLTDAAAGVKATSEVPQESDPDGNFPAGIYISGYLGSNWAADDNAAGALLMDVVDEANEVYAFTWAAPAATVTVTLKITMEDTNSTLYLKDVPVKTDGTSVIDGSIYSWNSGIPVTIKNEDYSDITGGIFDAAMTATANADWALTNYVNGNKDVDLAEKFGMTGANDVLQLSIDAEKFVPYVKGQESVFSWNNAQGRLLAPTTGNTNSVTVTDNNNNTETINFSELSTKLSTLSAGTYTLKVSGGITNTTITEIANAMNSNTEAKINLDLSDTDGLTEIPEFAFCRSDTLEGCSNLLSITIPNSVTTIGDYAFSHCENLTSVTIPNNVTTIGVSAFSYCENLTSVKIPDNVTEIKMNTFISCTALNSVTIGNGVTSIGASAFYNCSGLTSIEIPDSVTTIDQQAFHSCSSLTNVTIPDSVTTIGTYAFYYCENLTSVTFKDTNGWYYNDDSDNKITINVTDNTGGNATYLKETYYVKYWYKESSTGGTAN